MRSVMLAATLACIGPAGAACGQPAASAQDAPAERSLRVGDATRSYLFAAAGQSPAPLVIALHGGGGNAATMVPRWLDLARREGFAVAFPQGVGRTPRAGTWNAGGCCAHAMTSGSDDVAFIAALTDELVRQGAADPRRIYVTGLSNGGMLTHRIGIALNDRVAPIAVVAGAMFGGEQAPPAPLPVLIMHGERDEVVPFAGGQSLMGLVAQSQSRPFAAVRDAVDFWRRADGCASAPAISTAGDISIETSAPCRDGVEVILYRLRSAGHSWPGTARSETAVERARYAQIEASEAIWAFFRRHSRARPH